MFSWNQLYIIYNLQDLLFVVILQYFWFIYLKNVQKSWTVLLKNKNHMIFKFIFLN